MVVTGGKVGIGTNAPSSKLQVVGTITSTTIKLGDTTNNTTLSSASSGGIIYKIPIKCRFSGQILKRWNEFVLEYVSWRCNRFNHRR